MFTNRLKKKAFYFALSLVPTPLRHAFYRRVFARVPTEVPQGLSFEMARTKEDLEAAFRLLHDAYVEQGFIQPQENGMRLTIQHALPTTSILVAKINQRVVGTISVMRDTALGLPMEKVFDIGPLKRSGKRVAELSCLAIHPDYRRKMGGHIFFPLTLYAATFAERSLGTDHLILNLYPQHADFYNAIFGSRSLNDEVKDYLGAPAKAVHVDLAASFRFAKKKYSGLPADRDLYAYTYTTPHHYLHYPPAENGSVNQPVMTPEIFRYFFSERTQILQNLTELEEQVVSRYYPLQNYAVILPFRQTQPQKQRKSPRWDTRLQSRFDQDRNATILDISKEGFRAHFSEKLKEDAVYEFKIDFASGSLATIFAKVVWQKEDGVCGLQILNGDANWHELVERQARQLRSLAS